MSHGHRLTLPSNARLTLATLGGAGLSCAEPRGEPALLLGPGKPLALIVYLAFSPRRTASREHLIDLLWADVDPDRASHALRQTVWQLRQTLGEDALLTHNGDLVLKIPITSDRDEFLAAVEAGALEQAVERYRGDFLPALAVPGGAEFEHWADLERSRLRTAFVRSAESLVRRHLAAGHVREAQKLARRVRDTGRLNESGWRLLLEALTAGNDYVAAAMEADALEHLLGTEEREPEPATRAALRLARQVPIEEGSPKPALVAELVGREKEFAGVVSAWEAARHGPASHVHITAPAGLGKTRLLQDILARLRAGGARAVYARANPGERHIASAFAGDLAATLARLPGATGVSTAVAGTLVALNPALSGVYAAPADKDSGEDAIRRRTIALAELLLAVADEAPVALLLDDLHWADPQSRQIVQGMRARIDSARVLLVSASRPSPEHVRAIGATHLKLEPLSDVQIGALIGSLGALPAEPWARSLPGWLHVSTGGSPLLVIESIQLALERGSLTLDGACWACPSPAALAVELAAGGALRHRIEQLDRTSQWILLTLAAAGMPLSSALLARLAARPEDSITPLLGALEERGLVVRAGSEWEPGHDEIAALALENATPDALRAAHSGLGKALAEEAMRDAPRAPHAARHLAAGNENGVLDELWRGWIRERRRRGDRRPTADLAAELLGEGRSEARVAHLVAQLPWSVRLGLDTRQRVAAVALAGLGLAAVAIGVFSRPASPVEAVLLAAQPQSPDSTRVWRLDLHRGEWDGLDALVPRAIVGRQLRSGDFQYGMSPRADGAAWLVTRSFLDSGGMDVVLVREDSARVRLTTTAGDDGTPAFSPDGTRIIFSTARWSRWSHYSLATEAVGSDSVSRLTWQDVTDAGAQWSPDGTRIAFARRHFDGREVEVCWMTVDARRVQCDSPARGTRGAVIGWLDPQRLLVELTMGDSNVVAVFDLSGRRLAVLRTGVVSATASPDGRLIACLCNLPGRGSSTWVVFPGEHPEDVKEFRVPFGDPHDWAVSWGGTALPPHYLDRLEIVAPPGLPLNAPTRLRLAGFDPVGREVLPPPAVLAWSVSDTTVATIDSGGVLLPRRPGNVLVRLSAGGWRTDTAVVSIGTASGDSSVLRENWGRGIDPLFVPYGQPQPTVVRTADGQAAFWNRGDGKFQSGAISRNSFSARRGLGVEAVVSTPVTGIQWQIAMIRLVAGVDSAALSDHTDRDDAPLSHLGTGCFFIYPADEGLAGRTKMDLRGGTLYMDVSAPRTLGSGRPFTIRLQILPDGRCALAVDGKPIAFLETRLPVDSNYRLDLYGNSFDTKILIGPVEMWQGVKGGVDWLSLSHH